MLNIQKLVHKKCSRGEFGLKLLVRLKNVGTTEKNFILVYNLVKQQIIYENTFFKKINKYY
jgi:hypothetical protein